MNRLLFLLIFVTVISLIFTSLTMTHLYVKAGKGSYLSISFSSSNEDSFVEPTDDQGFVDETPIQGSDDTQITYPDGSTCDILTTSCPVIEYPDGTICDPNTTSCIPPQITSPPSETPTETPAQGSGDTLDSTFVGPTSDSTVSCNPNAATVARGDQGDAVTTLQNSLMTLGYSLPQFGADGDFGSETEAAVIQFQTNNGLDVNGIVGPDTWARLCELLSSSGGTESPPVKTTPPQVGPISTRIPSSGPGYYTYCPRNPCENPDDRQFGTSQTIDSITEIAGNWNNANPNGPRIGIGDISLQGGGAFKNVDGTQAHSTHRDGKDVDIRPLRKDGMELPTNIADSSYDRELTRALLNTIRENPNVVRVLFNDEILIGEGLSAYSAGHGNHLHIDFRD